MKLDSNTTLKTLRTACESLGPATGGSKKTCLKRLWDHLQAQEMIAAHGAKTQLQAELQRPVHAQPVPADPTDKERADHMLTHQPYASWCELCVANRAVQDPHPQRVEASGDHSCVSFDFGYASRFDGETKACGLFIHDRDTGAMHVIPTPQKGGKHLAYLCTEFCRFITWLGHSTISLKCDQEPATLSVLEAVRKTCRALGIKTHVETVAPGSHASNGGAEVTVKVLRQNANVLIQQLEQGCGISDVIGCHHPLYQWSLLHSAWVHNRFVVRQGLTPYEICSGRSYNGRLALFGESVLGFLKVSTKGAPQWTKGIWLGKTSSNDVHIIAVPGHPRLFVTRSVRRFPKPWDGEMMANMEATPWQFGYASLGSQLVLAKRISSPAPLPLPPVAPRDLDAEAVMGVPPTPDEQADDDVGPVPATPAMPRVLAPPSTSVSVSARHEPDDDMEVSAEAGITSEHGASAPVTPPVEGATSSTVSAGGAADVSVHGAHVHQRDDADEGGDSRPSKQQRLLRFCEHEEDSHFTFFETEEIDELERYDYGLDDVGDDSDEPQLSLSTSSDDVLKLLTVPFTTLEPNLSGEQLLRLDLLADSVEIERLKRMKVLLPVETYDCKGQTPKRLTTRMVRTWRDKHIQGQHVWLRRSRYVAREFAWLSPDRQDLFSPASSVLTVRLLPTLYMKWKLSNYILCAIDIADAFLMVEQKELTQVTCEDAAGQTTEFMLGRVLPGQRNGSQLWHECFSNLLKSELGFAECEAYPCLLRTGGCECLLMLHVDDVLCLSHKDYLECVLLPALKAKYKISCEKVENPGDELTFLKRRHMLLSENELAVQSHPKHLERLFDLMHINRNLKPKRTPGHPMLDEPDDTAELGPSDASTYRSCVGVLLYIAADYVECQYTIRGLSQCMAKPTVRALACLRHLCMYLLGCIDHCIMLSYKAHHGLLHYNELDYTLEVYSDSDWAKHKTTRRSVSSGCLFLFGNLLYSTSRSQKALALSSAEAEIYSAAGACCDGVLMFYCLSFAIGPELEVRFQLCLDNSAARAFFCRSGVGRIRHISLRILWVQAKVKE